MTDPRRRHFGWSVLLLAMSGAAGAATEYGTVVSSTPVLSQVSIPERSCIDEEVTTSARPRTKRPSDTTSTAAAPRPP